MGTWGTAGLVFASTLGLVAGCGRSDNYKFATYDVGAEVQNDATGQPMPGVEVELWIVDQGLRPAQRSTIALVPSQTTNAEGRAVWQYQAQVEPRICGYRVTNSADEVIAEVTPEVSKEVSLNATLVQISIE